MRELAERFKARIEHACRLTGTSYPWWLAVWTTTLTLSGAVVAFVQRDAAGAGPFVALLLCFVPVLWWTVTARLLPMPVEAAMIIVAAVLFLLRPVGADIAPLLLIIRVAEVAATVRLRASVPVAALSAAVLGVAAGFGHLHTAPIYFIGLLLGFDIGVMLQWYMRALAAERDSTALARREARSDERRRIAREVHDVVGHSLSITLLHVTAARHALQQHADIVDALESLAEAERLGRAAMTDVRRSVSVLGEEHEDAPLPGVEDIAGLVDSSRAAGLDVRFAPSGAVRVGDVAGLELYRIAQESLANVAKHAPAARVHVALDACTDGVRLSVRSTLPQGTARRDEGGLGLPGMADRARQMGGRLHAGPDGGDWLVDVVVPAHG